MDKNSVGWTGGAFIVLEERISSARLLQIVYIHLSIIGQLEDNHPV
ncbi:MAG: hypothetical protein OEL58_05215 [Desulfobacteraceae bacterium]|nr:hypothetical protein [Desulfobacteraceae bacterium]